MKELNRKFASQACSSQTFEISGRYFSCASAIGFELLSINCHLYLG